MEDQFFSKTGLKGYLKYVVTGKRGIEVGEETEEDESYICPSFRTSEFGCLVNRVLQG